jgi:hypothetical protein
LRIEKYENIGSRWQEANKQLQRSGLKKSMFRDMVEESNLEFRDGTDDFFVELAKSDVPVLLLSAGVGDLVYVMKRPESACFRND